MMYHDSSNIVQWLYFSNYFGAESPDTVLLIHKMCCLSKKVCLNLFYAQQGHPPSADLRYGEEDSISLSTFILAAIKG